MRDRISPPPALQDNSFAHQLAHTISRWGLTLPALFILGAGQPISFLTAQFLWVAQPTLSLVFSRHALQQLAETLESPLARQQLVHLLENETL